MLLKTPRLILRPQTQADAPSLFTILSDPEAMRFWNRPPIAQLAVVEEQIAEQQAAMASGFCRYWTLLEDGHIIGSVDLSLIKSSSAELGFLLRRDRWGAGLATEAAAAVIAHGFGPLGLTRLAAAVQADNRAASRVLEKNGFARVETHMVAIASGERRDCAFYLLER
jgi:ribosomal-protein-alanine N-acetyltransferase